LVEHWDPADWSRLWWVRAALQFQDGDPDDRGPALAGLLSRRYPQYREQPFDRILVLRLVGLTGWAAAEA
jgi:hypothetical protein